MSDHTSAEIFGKLFTALADLKDGKTTIDEVVQHAWTASYNYDFSNYQMDADDALIRLGYAIKGAHVDYPGEEVVLYKTRKGTWEP